MSKIKTDWPQLQQELDLYKIENRDKTLKDFCEVNNISYNSARHKIKVKNARKNIKVYDDKKNEAFIETLKKQALIEGEKQAFDYIEKTKIFNDVIKGSYTSFINKIKSQQDFDNIVETVRAMNLAVKSLVELQKIELNKGGGGVNKELEEEEDNFFREILNAQIKTNNIIED